MNKAERERRNLRGVFFTLTEQDDGTMEERIDAMREGARGRIALSRIFTGIRDGIVACPVPMQS